MQTILGRGAEFEEPSGNCFAACIASLLELPLEDVPNFCDSDNWRERLAAWLRSHGLFYLDVTLQEGAEPLDSEWGYHVISGDGPRGCRHSVVGLAGVVVHDPHPKGGPLGPANREYGLLIPLDPAKVVERSR